MKKKPKKDPIRELSRNNMIYDYKNNNLDYHRID